MINLNSPELDYTWARPIGGDQWERVIDSEGRYEEDGSMGPPDMFELEHSGWQRQIEFKPKNGLDEGES